MVPQEPRPALGLGSSRNGVDLAERARAEFVIIDLQKESGRETRLDVRDPLLRKQMV